MTVYKKIVTIRITDPKKPHKEFQVYLNQIGGINPVLLQIAPGIGEATYEFVCSDQDPETPRNMEDIDRLLSNSKIKILNEMSSHPKDPITSGKANQLLKIDAVLDNPNINDKFLSKAKDVHEESVTEENLKSKNEQIDWINKHKSPNDPDKLKSYDENKTTLKVGEVERE